MSEHDIPPIDLVVVNLYPFEATVADPDCDLPRAIENIDIGGPTMLRAAAKNNRFVASWSTRRLRTHSRSAKEQRVLPRSGNPL